MNNPTKSTQENPKSYSVVVADDDRAMANLLAANLRRLGHRVVGIARDGREAIAMSLKKRPDVIIMDIHMPIIDGLKAAHQILDVQSIPIVLSTGVADVGTILRAADLKIISYLVKPYCPAQLKVALHLAVTQCRGQAIPGTAVTES